MEARLENPPHIVHPLEVLTGDGFIQRIQNSIQRDLSGLQVVCYYGCHISRPAQIMQFDDPEDPQSMDRLLNWVGIKTIDWSRKVDCCGAHFSLIKPDVVVKMCSPILAEALDTGADAIIVACPMCHANLDTRQQMIAEQMDQQLDIPVLYFSQVLGYALGLTPKDLGFKKHIIDPIPLMLEKCQSQSFETMEAA
jgi:heterodisulfide reductase subunit B